jgi:hypothetical protein
MAVDTAQLISDAECILACVPSWLIEAAQVAQLSQATVVTTGQVAITGVPAQQILAQNPKRRLAVIQNLSAINTAFAGPSTVTVSGSTTGMRMATTVAAPELSWLFLNTTAEIWVASSAGTTIGFIEFSTP